MNTNKVIYIVVVSLLVLVSSGAPAAFAQEDPADWQIRLIRLRVSDAQEDGWLSDGDEPYFVVIGFRSTFDTPGSTSAFWGRYLDDEWAEGAFDGDEHRIPSDMGVVSFPNVDYVPLSDVLAGTNPEVIGALVIAFESDSTPWGTMRDLIEDVRDAVEEETRRLVENGDVVAGIQAEDLEEAVANIEASVTLGFWDAVESFFDVDEVVGKHLFVFVATDNWRAGRYGFPVSELERGLHMGALRENYFPLPSNPLRFSGSDATYRVSARVVRD